MNWGIASHWWAETDVPQYAHADHHAIIFHPQYDGVTNRTMFIGNDGGIFRTDDARAAVATGSRATCNPGSSAVRRVSLNNNYGVTQFYHGLPFPDGTKYFGGTQDNGTLLGADGSGANGWREIYGGDGGYVAIDPTRPEVMYLENTYRSISKSTDGGKTFSRAQLGFEYLLGDASLFITPFVMDPSNPDVLWTGGISAWRTDDGATHWKLVGSGGGTGAGQVSAIAVAPTDSNYVLVGQTYGAIYRSDHALTIKSDPLVPGNDEASWSRTVLSPGQATYVSWLTFDPANKFIAYATSSTFGSKHVWRSMDAGATWTAIDGAGPNSSPDVPANCIVVDPTSTARLYVGTDLGVMVSVDGGATWAVENSGFANTIVESLAINTVGGVTSLYAFTHGRGAYKVALGSGCQPPVFTPTQRFSVAGGEVSLQVSTPAQGCPWTVTSNTDWVSVISADPGSGMVRLAATANPAFEPRTGTVTIGNRSLTVRQEARIDTTPPRVSFIHPVPNGGVITLNEGYADLTIAIGDDNAITGATVERNNAQAFIVIPPGKFPDELRFPVARLDIGVNRFTARVRDAAGHRAEASITINFLPQHLIETVAGTDLQGFDGDGGPARQARLWNPLSTAFDSTGNLYIADETNGRIRRIDAQTGIITTVAGKGYPNGYASSGDGGPALDAVLAGPSDVKVDQAGNLYISERARIRKVTPDGIIRTIAGNGTDGSNGDGGPATEARVGWECYLNTDHEGNLYVCDRGWHRVRKISAATGIITTIAGTGTAGFSGDGGPATAAKLASPTSIAFDSAGNLYIADHNNHRIRKVSASTGIITTFAGNGSTGTATENVPAPSTPLPYPRGVAVDATGAVFVSSDGHIRLIGTDGLIRTIAGTGNYYLDTTDHIPALQASVGTPLLSLDGAGNIYFAAPGINRICRIYPLNLTLGQPSISITTPSTSGSYVTTQRFLNLSGTAAGGTITRLLWRTDRGYRGMASGTTQWRIEDVPLLAGINRITITAEDPVGASSSVTMTVTCQPEQVVRRVAGQAFRGRDFSGDGASALSALLWEPRSVAADRAGNLYIADTGNFRIRKVAPDGTITTFAGTGRVGTGGDGGPSTAAELNQPGGLVCDAAGSLYIADTQNNRVRRVTADGIISTVAGNGTEDFGGDGGPATQARLALPLGLTLDAAGNLFIADTGNHRIRRVDAKTGLITTVAGSGTRGLSGDGGPATEAALDLPVDVAVDSQGNLFIADRRNLRIRKVSPAGTISTFAIDSKGGGSGTVLNPLWTFNGVETDPAGNVYVSSQADNGVLKFTPDGNATLYAGVTGTANGYFETGDGGAATGIAIYSPGALCFDRAGNLFVAATGNNQVLMISDYKAVTSVSAASFSGPETSAEAIVAAFGSGFATTSRAAESLPLPLTLDGLTVRVRDSADSERLAPLFFVSPTQINYQIPAGTAPGAALVTVMNSSGQVFTGAVQVDSAAPALFTAAASGEGPAAALILRFKSDGSQVYEPVARYNATQNLYEPVPISLSDPAEQVFLVLFGTGIRHRSSPEAVAASVGGRNVEVLYAGKQPGYAGLDQVNLRLPASLAGSGEVSVLLTVDGKSANPVRIQIR